MSVSIPVRKANALLLAWMISPIRESLPIVEVRHAGIWVSRTEKNEAMFSTSMNCNMAHNSRAWFDTEIIPSQTLKDLHQCRSIEIVVSSVCMLLENICRPQSLWEWPTGIAPCLPNLYSTKPSRVEELRCDYDRFSYCHKLRDNSYEWGRDCRCPG